MPNIWFTSDLHLGHELVATKRGFIDSAEHDTAIARRWDRQVQPDDEVWVLGDVAMNGWRDRMEWVAERPGTKHLVLGNHDRAHPLHSRAHEYARDYLAVFDTVQTAARVNLNGITVLASHFPYTGDREHERFTQWRLRDEGKYLVHGHTHLPDRLTITPLGTAQLHVGLDAWRFDLVHHHTVKMMFGR